MGTKEWTERKQSIVDLQNFINKNSDLTPESVKHSSDIVLDNIRRFSTHDGSLNEKENIDDYANFMHEVDAFLNAPDRSEKDCSFKEEIEKYLELIEDTDQGEEEL